VIISASRRCDLPAFGFESFLRSVAEGSVDLRNPFNAASIRRVSLAPNEVDCIVFWTRDPRPLLAGLDRLGELRERCFVQVTVTGYPPSLEPGVAPTGAIIEAVRILAARIGRERIAWRYDPVILAEGLDPAFHLSNFARLAEALAGSVAHIVLSLLDEYVATRGRLGRAGYASPLFGSPRGEARAGDSRESALPPQPWPELLAGLAAITTSRGLETRACAEPFDLSPLGIAAEPCIDGPRLGKLFGFSPPEARDRGQRPACRCASSVDIGEYGKCPAACVYCYARR